MPTDRRALLLFMTFLLFTSCATHTSRMGVPGPSCYASDARLDQAWRELNETLETPGGCEVQAGVRCQALRDEIGRLAVDCPNHPGVLMANALLAFSAREYVRTQQLLDQLFAMREVHPEAAALRARIAMEEGNLQFAVRFLAEQIQLSADDSNLRETYASALYLAGRWDEAREQLNAALKFGAPAWRVAYGMGLIDEMTRQFEAARQHYLDALKGKPGWKAAESRLRGLSIAH